MYLGKLLNMSILYLNIDYVSSGHVSVKIYIYIYSANYFKFND